MSNKQHVLIVMRLADMARVHPDQIEDKCSHCGEVVGIYPSGQKAMALLGAANFDIVCEVCHAVPVDFRMMAPGFEREAFESVPRRSKR